MKNYECSIMIYRALIENESKDLKSIQIAAFDYEGLERNVSKEYPGYKVVSCVAIG